MNEQRRHQRIRFNNPPRVLIGQLGHGGGGELENLSLGGMLVHTELPLQVGEAFGSEFVVFDSPLIDMSAQVVNKIGDRYGARFQAGPVSELLIAQAIANALSLGKASVLSINELQGRKVMRVVGGLNDGLRNDFMHGLTKVGVDELDLSAVSNVDSAGLVLCRLAVDQFRTRIVAQSPCVEALMLERVS